MFLSQMVIYMGDDGDSYGKWMPRMFLETEHRKGYLFYVKIKNERKNVMVVEVNTEKL